MSGPDIARARSRHATLRRVVDACRGAPDAQRLRIARALCEELQQVLDDDYCREKLRVVADCAAQLLSPRLPSQWSGREDPVRRRMLVALALLQSRLAKLEQPAFSA